MSKIEFIARFAVQNQTNDMSHNLKQNEAQSTHAESTNKGAN